MKRDTKTIHLAADHAGFEQKNAIKDWLATEGYSVIDHGARRYDTEDDYPDFITKAAQAVSVNPREVAILFGGSGQGEAMLANRFRNVRTTVYYGGSDEIITLSKEHNDANALSIGARFVTTDEAKRVIWLWLHTKTDLHERHQRRINKIESITRSLNESDEQA